MAGNSLMDVRMPDGTVVKNVPEGTTQEELMSLLSGGRQQGGNNLLDTLDSLDRRQSAAPQEAPQDGMGYIAQQAKKGFAAALGAPVDAITNALNLGIAGYGVAKHELTGSTDLPQPIRNPVGGAGTFERMMLTNDNIQPEGPVSRVGGRFVRDLAAASVPVAGMAGRPGAFLPRNTGPVQQLAASRQGVAAPLAIGTGTTALASGAGESARAVAPEQYKDAADMSGMLLAGIALPALVANRVETIGALSNARKPNNVNRVANNMVSRQIEADARGYPKAAQNLDDAMQAQEQIPGLLYRAGQSTGVPSLLDMERRVATSSGDRFNQRAIQDQAQRQAILAKAEKDLPLLAGKHDIEQRLAQVRQRSGLEDHLPEVDPAATGQLLRSARSSMKGRYDQIAAKQYDDVAQEAEKLRVYIDPARIIQRVDEAVSSPVAQFDPKNVPEISRRIFPLKDPGGKDTPKLLGPDGKDLPAGARGAYRIDFKTLNGLRQAVNQDIAREVGSANPNARQRLRELLSIKQEINHAVQDQAPESVRKLDTAANSWYRDVYAPKFLRGVNLKQTMKDITGEQRISDEKLAGQYFKKMSSTPMDRFLTLYGENPQAMTSMKNHILDAYRREVVRDGVIDPKKHEAFMRGYEPSLKKLPEVSDGLKNLGFASRTLGEREAQLIQAQNVLSKGQLSALTHDNPDVPGLDLKKLESFIKKDGARLKESITEIYGPAEAERHMANLQKIAKASEIAERGSLHVSAHPRQGLEPFDFQGKIGFTPRTLFNMVRAVTTGRTSAEDVMFTLGAQAGTHRFTQALIAAEERAISDPQTAKLLAEAMKHPFDSQAGKKTLGQLLEKGGLFLLGGNKWADVGKHRMAPTAVEATRMGAEGAEQEQGY